jgi:hypothetical protein
MTAKLNSSLEAHGIVSANSSAAYTLYDPSLGPLSLPDARPTCVIEATLGDRRLGTHVLAGLELLLPSLLTAEMIDVDRLVAAFPKNRPGKESSEHCGDRRTNDGLHAGNLYDRRGV